MLARFVGKKLVELSLHLVVLGVWGRCDTPVALEDTVDAVELLSYLFLVTCACRRRICGRSSCPGGNAIVRSRVPATSRHFWTVWKPTCPAAAGR